MDLWTQRMAVGGVLAMGLAALLACVGMHALAVEHDHGLCQLAATCAGVLAGLAWPAHTKPPA